MEVKFIKSAAKSTDWINDDTTEFCFIGRSNCGKSSLINAIANKKVAKSSATPGRTRLVNFFDCKYFRLVDLPGYGYAKASKNIKDYIEVIIYDYLLHRKNLFGVFQICDANVLTDDDIRMCQFLRQRFVNHFIVLNKIDKRNINDFKNNIAKIANYLGVRIDNIILVSAKKKININLITKKINDCLKTINK